MRRNGTNGATNVRMTVTDMTVTVATSVVARVEKSLGNVRTAATMISAAGQDTTETGTTIDVGISADVITSSVLSDVGMMTRTIEGTVTSVVAVDVATKSRVVVNPHPHKIYF